MIVDDGTLYSTIYYKLYIIKHGNYINFKMLVYCNVSLMWV